MSLWELLEIGIFISSDVVKHGRPVTYPKAIKFLHGLVED